MSFATRVPQMPVMPSDSGVILGKDALAHQRRGDRDAEQLGELTAAPATLPTACTPLPAKITGAVSRDASRSRRVGDAVVGRHAAVP